MIIYWTAEWFTEWGNRKWAEGVIIHNQHSLWCRRWKINYRSIKCGRRAHDRYADDVSCLHWTCHQVPLRRLLLEILRARTASDNPAAAPTLCEKTYYAGCESTAQEEPRTQLQKYRTHHQHPSSSRTHRAVPRFNFWKHFLHHLLWS